MSSLRTTFVRRLLVAVLLLAASPWGGRAVAADARAEVLERWAPAIVRIEAVLKTRFNMAGQGDEQESRLDLMGVTVSPDGLLMIWNSHISSSRMTDMMREMGRGGDFEIDISPTDFKVYSSAEDREARAFLAATDSAMDLAFLQLAEPPEKALPFVDFSAAVTPAVGEPVAAVSRLGRSFDYAPYVQSARIGGQLHKPRAAWILDGQLDSFGLPVFDLQGRPVGALTTIFSRAGDEGAAGMFGPGGFMGQMVGASGSSGPLGTFVLPGERVATLVRLAAERAAELLAERRRRDAEEGAGEEPADSSEGG